MNESLVLKISWEPNKYMNTNMVKNICIYVYIYIINVYKYYKYI